MYNYVDEGENKKKKNCFLDHTRRERGEEIKECKLMKFDILFFYFFFLNN